LPWAITVVSMALAKRLHGKPVVGGFDAALVP
jgi:hypothetical protein